MMDKRKEYDAMSRGDKMADLRGRRNSRVAVENALSSAKEMRQRNVQERGLPAKVYDEDVAFREKELQDATDRENYKDLIRPGYKAGGMVRRGYGKARGA